MNSMFAHLKGLFCKLELYWQKNVDKKKYKVGYVGRGIIGLQNSDTETDFFFIVENGKLIQIHPDDYNKGIPYCFAQFIQKYCGAESKYMFVDDLTSLLEINNVPYTQKSNRVETKYVVYELSKTTLADWEIREKGSEADNTLRTWRWISHYDLMTTLLYFEKHFIYGVAAAKL